MFDKDLARSILIQIDDALEKINTRTIHVDNADYFTHSPEGMERLDGICMLFIAIGEGLKNLDKITNSNLLPKYPEVDWVGVKGFRDIIAHHYFNINAEQIFYVCKHELGTISAVIKKMIKDLE